MGDQWTSQASASLGGGPTTARVTLVEGSAFAVCAPNGDISPLSAEGFFFRDSRFLSRWSLEVNGQVPEHLATATPEPFSAIFVARTHPRPGRADSNLMVVRHRYVGRGMREDLEVRNFSQEPAYCAMTLSYGADFSDLFEVKAARATGVGELEAEHVGGDLVWRHRHGSHRRSLRIALSQPAVLDSNIARFEVIVAPKGRWSLCQQFVCTIDDEEIEPRWLCGQPVSRAKPAERMAAWRRAVPVIDTDHEGLRAVVAVSAEDLGSLRIFDPDFPERAVVAAGAPWFMTL
ncbi:MAG: glycogen debranching N-terminal domain-containing protein, partial [Acidimicrobiales bacterium]